MSRFTATNFTHTDYTMRYAPPTILPKLCCAASQVMRSIPQKWNYVLRSTECVGGTISMTQLGPFVRGETKSSCRFTRQTYTFSAISRVGFCHIQYYISLVFRRRSPLYLSLHPKHSLCGQQSIALSPGMADRQHRQRIAVAVSTRLPRYLLRLQVVDHSYLVHQMPPAEDAMLWTWR